jgi:hypothetical protein
MEPRDVPWFWLLSRMRGRRDMLILRGQLHSAPRLEFEVLAPGSWTGQSAASRAAQAQWGDEPLDEYRFVAPKASLPVSRRNVPKLLESAHRMHRKIWRLAVRREFPQLELHIPMPDPKTCDAEQFFSALRSLAQQASSSGETVTNDL